MVQIKPLVDGEIRCEPGGVRIPAEYVLWQGIHVCAITRKDGKDRFVQDLPIGHSAHYPFKVDLAERRIDGLTEEVAWLGQPLLDTLLSPKNDRVRLTVEVFKRSEQVIIVNCLDFMYGHCLLKLLNAERHLQDEPGRGVIVLIPAFLRWLVPDGVAEVWTVDLGLKQMRAYYPSLHEQITKECTRFQTIFLSEAYSHPSRFQLETFTRIAGHEFTEEPPVITFIWREDRPWLPDFWWRYLRKLRWHGLLLHFQNWQIRRFFKHTLRERPAVKCCVAGLGTSTKFPAWIEDHRVGSFSPESERATARLYARSRIVVGVHGSNMLLPSGLAGMTIDLMPQGKWDCLSTDILFREKDARLSVVRYRFVPTDTRAEIVAQIALSLLKTYRTIVTFLTEDR